MKSDNSQLEKNVKRLLGAALEERIRPSPEARSETLSMLTNLVHARRTDFPEPVLGILGVLILLGAILWLGGAASYQSTNVPPVLLYLLQFLGALNLLTIPFAGLVIFIRRRSSNVSAD